MLDSLTGGQAVILVVSMFAVFIWGFVAWDHFHARRRHHS